MKSLILLGLGFLSVAVWAKGAISSATNQVFLKKAERGEQRARRGQRVDVGDQIITKAASFAKITMDDGNVFQVGPDSAVIFNKYDTAEGDRKDSVLSVLYGRLRSTLEKKYDGDENRFRLNTESAIMGVRGTDFLTTFSQVTRQSSVITFSGLVEVFGIDGEGDAFGEQELGPGQMTLIGLGQAPLEPITLPTQELQKFEQSSQGQEKHSLEEAATEPESANTAGLNVISAPSVDTDEGTLDDIVDSKVVGDTQGQFVRIIVDDSDSE